MEGYIGMPAVHWPYCEACVSCHCSMDCTLSKKRAVYIIRRVARYGPDHVCRICRTKISHQILIKKREGKLNYAYSLPIYLRLMVIFLCLEK